MEQYMTPEQRAAALQMLGGGALAQAGQQVSAPARAAQVAGQVDAAGGMPQGTPMGGPAMQPSPVGGPVQPSGYMPQGVPRQDGGRMTPTQAKKLADILRNRS